MAETPTLPQIGKSRAPTVKPRKGLRYLPMRRLRRGSCRAAQPLLSVHHWTSASQRYFSSTPVAKEPSANVLELLVYLDAPTLNDLATALRKSVGFRRKTAPMSLVPPNSVVP